MAKLIVKSPYIKCTGSSGAAGAGGYLNYIGTREHVELIPDDRPPARKQEQLIAKLVKDFPSMKELFEYEDYHEHPTKANASALITLAFETNWDAVSQMGTYMQYIATRPRAERISSHGLFGDEDHVDLDTAMVELNSYAGNVWTHIISLHREDATRLGYDNAATWRNLIRTHRNEKRSLKGLLFFGHRGHVCPLSFSVSRCAFCPGGMAFLFAALPLRPLRFL